MPQITVIMPSLNVAKYIERSVKSVAGQTLTDIEILCIDAGSTDGTLEIIQKLAESDPRIRVIQCPVKSYGYQVNLGIREARGKYISIVETDDEIMPEMYEKLYSVSEKYNLDYCKGNALHVYKISENDELAMPASYIRDADLKYGIAVKPAEYLHAYLQDWSIWSGIYNRGFLISNDIFCNESPGAAYQDIGFTTLTYLLASKAVYLAEPLYLYTYARPGSSSCNVNCLTNAMLEFDRLLNGIDGRHIELRHYAFDIFIKMCQSFYTESTKVLKEVEFNPESEKFDVPYRLLCQRFGELSEEERKTCIEYLHSTRPGMEEPLTDLSGYIASIRYKYLEQDRFHRFLETSLREGRRIVIFGCGNWGMKTAAWIANNFGITSIDAFTDNDSAKWDRSMGPYSVLPPSEAVTKYSSDLFLISNKNAADDIRRQLITDHIIGVEVQIDGGILFQKKPQPV